MLEYPMYSNIRGRMVIYWLSDIGVSFGSPTPVSLSLLINNWESLDGCRALDFELDQ